MLSDNQVDIKVENFTISIGGLDLLLDTTLHITNKRKYALIGQNGCGKSTLLHYINSRYINIPLNINILCCNQEVLADDTKAIDVVLNSDISRLKLLNECKLLEINNNDNDRLIEIYNELKIIKSDSAESKVRHILFGLGFTNDMMEKSTKDLSGGWRMKLSLARALFLEPTLLMLDEPTNHLDLNAVIWLNNYLQQWKNTLLIISHDQNFIDDICTDIIHIYEKKLCYYKGNYTLFRKMLLQKYNIQLKEYNKKCKKSKKISINKPYKYIVKFVFTDPIYINPPVLELYNVTFNYLNNDELFVNLNFNIDMNSRIAIVGPNGIGKSTFLKLLSLNIIPQKGECRINSRLKIGMYNQHSEDQLNTNISSIEYISNKYGISYQDTRKMLSQFGINKYLHSTIIQNLSGGQKSRVALIDLACQKPDILILDEPTNNLDIESINALIESINKFKGGIVIVSHNEYLIRSTNCQLWIIENKSINEIDGDFDDYKSEVLKLYN